MHVGLLNLASWNVGYHNEHHDFPRVPGWKLPLVKAMAPEFYEHLPSHASWTGVIWKFITNPDITPFSRVVRKHSKK
jgi:sphingolipid delta-4 desaturase